MDDILVMRRNGRLISAWRVDVERIDSCMCASSSYTCRCLTHRITVPSWACPTNIPTSVSFILFSLTVYTRSGPFLKRGVLVYHDHRKSHLWRVRRHTSGSLQIKTSGRIIGCKLYSAVYGSNNRCFVPLRSSCWFTTCF